jgi:uncharacterized protein (DUF983 family)
MIEIESDLPGAAAHGLPADKPRRGVASAMMRGALGRCPACGEGRLYQRYLKVADHCPHCGEALHHQRADDAPPYFTIFAVGHIMVPLMLAVEAAYRPELWVHVLLWGPSTVALCLALLPMIKGAVVGLQWALYMHGFDPDAEAEPQDGSAALAPIAREA